MKRLLALALLVVAHLALFAAPTPALAAAAGPAVPDQLLLGYRDGSAATDHQRARNLVGATPKSRLRAQVNGEASLELVQLPPHANLNAAIALLQRDPGIAFAEPNWVYTTPAAVTAAYPADRGFKDGGLWGMYGTDPLPSGACAPGKVCTSKYGSQAADAWNQGKTGSRSVYVGVIDEGIWQDHPDLQANIWTNPYDPIDQIDNDRNGYVDDTHGWDFANNDNTIFDRVPGDPVRNTEDDHGTHVAGTIGAVGNNTEWDGGGLLGVNWQVTMISAKFLSPSSSDTASAIKAIDYFIDLKTRHDLNIVALNNSWVCAPNCYSQAFHDATIRAAKANILFVAAAGNSGSNNDGAPVYPASYTTTKATSTSAAATYDAVIAVAALDSAGALPSWSNWGKGSVDLAAPGAGIWSTTGSVYSQNFSGTSMAAPHVSGAAALYASTHPGAGGAQIRAALLNSTVKTTAVQNRTVTGGRLDIEAALRR